MSTSCETSSTCPIPSRSNHEKSWAALPDNYSQTPGGTLFSTTPGGTRIIYDRKFLLECRNSPIARTPPCCLPHIPGVTRPFAQLAEQDEDNKDISGKRPFRLTYRLPRVVNRLRQNLRNRFQNVFNRYACGDDSQFVMDM